MMDMKKILVCLDFDHTLIDANSDVHIKSLAGNNRIPEEIENLKNDDGWVPYMQEIFKFLYQNNIRKEDYILSLSELTLVEGMKEILHTLHGTGISEIILLSDSNSFFIEQVLEQNGLKEVIADIFTNPAIFDENGCLQIKEYHYQDTCARCSRNLCKGSILEDYISTKAAEGITFQRVLYIGDGRNDVCPSLRLSYNDFVFARLGYSLIKSLGKMPAKNVKPTVHAWETGHDIKQILIASEI